MSCRPDGVGSIAQWPEHRVDNPEVIGSNPIGTTMIVKERPVVLYDIEVFPNCFHCTCKDSENYNLYKFEISCRKNQLEELVDFFYTNRTDHIMCGYNNKHYDDAFALKGKIVEKICLNFMIDEDKTLVLDWVKYSC